MTDQPQHPAATNATAPVADARRSLRRTLRVWGIFAVACCATVFALNATGTASAQRVDRANSAKLLADRMPMSAGAQGGARASSVTPKFADLERVRWRCIVIHHSGTPAGDAFSLARKHVQDGLTGLGYHFVIGNGQGLDDGQVVVGYRWDRQLAGAHVAQALTVGRDAAFYNEHAVAICLVGNGERRAFTDRQIHELVVLVRQLQAELGIPATEVLLHGALNGTANPGQFFPSTEVFAKILP